MQISVIIPLYNKEKYIERCLKSMVKQTHKDLEIIVICDKPTDNSIEAARKVKDSRIRIIENEKNIGCASSRNVGMQAATSRVLTFQDADDFSSKHRIWAQYEAMKAYRAPVVRCRRMAASKIGIDYNDILYANWMGTHRTSGTFMSTMFPKYPLMLQDGELWHYNEYLWGQDMHYVWGPLLTIKAFLYWFEEGPQPFRLGADFGDDAKKNKEKGELMVRCKEWGYKLKQNRPLRLAKKLEEVKPVLASIKDGSFFEEGTHV